MYRIQGETSKLQTEKQLKHYPCALAFVSNPANKSSYLVGDCCWALLLITHVELISSLRPGHDR